MNFWRSRPLLVHLVQVLSHLSETAVVLPEAGLSQRLRVAAGEVGGVMAGGDTDRPGWSKASQNGAGMGNLQVGTIVL